MAENRKHLEFNITHYVCRTYLARQTLWLRNSNDFKRDFTSPYIGNIINEFQTSADTGSTKWRSPNRKQLYLAFYNRWARGSNGYTQVFRVTRLNGLIINTRRRRPTPKMQYGDRQTGSSYIYAELELIPSNSVGHVGFSCNTRRVRRHQKPRLAVGTTCLSVSDRET